MDAADKMLHAIYVLFCATIFCYCDLRSNGRTSGVNLMGNLGGGGDDDTVCGPKFESLIHIIGHDKTSDTVEDNLYQTKTK